MFPVVLVRETNRPMRPRGPHSASRPAKRRLPPKACGHLPVSVEQELLSPRRLTQPRLLRAGVVCAELVLRGLLITQLLPGRRRPSVGSIPSGPFHSFLPSVDSGVCTLCRVAAVSGMRCGSASRGRFLVLAGLEVAAGVDENTLSSALFLRNLSKPAPRGCRCRGTVSQADRSPRPAGFLDQLLADAPFGRAAEQHAMRHHHRHGPVPGFMVSTMCGMKA